MYPKCFYDRGSAPKPTGGVHSVPQDPLAGFGGRFAARKGGEWERMRNGGRERRGRKEKESRGTEGRGGERWGERGEKREGNLPRNPLGGAHSAPPDSPVRLPSWIWGLLRGKEGMRTGTEKRREREEGGGEGK